MLPSIKKKKAVPATGLKQYHEAFNNFDIKRFTSLGWLLFVIAVILGLFGAYLVNANYDLIMGAPDPNEVIIRKYYLPIGLGAAVGGLGTFFGGMGLLFLLGVKVIRPKMDDAE
jgi:H+/Cl- antiporter ClcA